MTMWGFLILTVVVIGFAGPFPTLVVGVLVLVLAGVVLSQAYYPGIVNLVNNVFSTNNPVTGAKPTTAA